MGKFNSNPSRSIAKLCHKSRLQWTGNNPNLNKLIEQGTLILINIIN